MSSFIDALLGSSRPIIMEIKRHGAYGQDLLSGRSLPDIVMAYEAARAPCLSVVTGRWFGGDDAMLREIAGLTRLPLLKKDFITNERQIVAARDAGVSAILLTARLLPRSALWHLIEVGLRQGVTPFVEVASADEINNPALADCVVAINNKDILRRERGPVMLERSPALLPAVLGSGTRCPVSASGINSPAQAARLLDGGFKGLLIGTALLLADDIGGWVAAVDHHRGLLEAV